MSANVLSELDRFRADLKRHEMFLNLESKIKNPANPRSVPKSETLLSAFVSLTCGRFEQYLQKVFYFAADDIKVRIIHPSDPRIIKGANFQWQNLNGFIKWASNARGVPKQELIAEIQMFSNTIAQGHIYPKSFQYTNSNPNSTTLKDMFNRFGIEDCLRKIANVYLDVQARRFSPLLIETNLDTFVRRRHQAAHLGRIVGVTRTDVRNDKEFILALAEAINVVIRDHLLNIR